MDDPDFSTSVITQQSQDGGYLQQPTEEIIGGESTVSIEVDPALAAELEAAAAQGDTWFKCGTCGEHFNDLALLLTHLQLHRNEEEGVAGGSADSDFPTQVYYEEQLQPCPYCNLTFYSRDFLDSHIRQHLEPSSFQKRFSELPEISLNDDVIAANEVIESSQDDYEGSSHIRPEHGRRTGGRLKLKPNEPLPVEYQPVVVIERLPYPLTEETVKTLVRHPPLSKAKRIRTYGCERCGDRIRDRQDFIRHVKDHEREEREIQEEYNRRAMQQSSKRRSGPGMTGMMGRTQHHMDMGGNQNSEIADAVRQISDTWAAEDQQHQRQMALQPPSPQPTATREAQMQQIHPALYSELSPPSKILTAEVCQVCSVKLQTWKGLKRHLQTVHKDMKYKRLLKLHERIHQRAVELRLELRRQQWAAAARARKLMKPEPDGGDGQPHQQRSSSMLMVEGPDGVLREYEAGESPAPGEDGERQYVCKICNARFVLKKSLRKHTREIHPEELATHHARMDSSLGNRTEEDLDQMRYPPEMRKSPSESRSRPSTDFRYATKVLREPKQVQLYSEPLIPFTQPPFSQAGGNALFVCTACGKQFLTAFGLERHTKLGHPESAPQLLADMQRTINDTMENVVVTNHFDDSGNTMAGSQQSSIAGIAHSTEESPHFKARQVFQPKPTQKSRAWTGGNLSRMNSTAESGLPDQSSYNLDDTGLTSQLSQFSADQTADDTSISYAAGDQQQEQNENMVGGEIYQCSICALQLAQLNAMQCHMKAHKRNDELREILMKEHGADVVAALSCNKCKVVFRDIHNLDQHIHAMHKGQLLFDCTKCSQQFSQRKELAQHLKLVHSVEPPVGLTPDSFFTCHSCRRKFISEKSLMNHCKMTRHQMNPGSGADDSFSESTPRPTARGRGRSDPSEESQCRSTCDICGDVLPKPSNLIRHMKVEHDRTNFTATVETKGMPPFKIDVFDGKFMWGCCDEVFDDRNDFIQHRRSMHVRKPTTDDKWGTAELQNNKSFARKCEICGIQFATVNGWVSHMRIHRARSCPVCQKAFGSTEIDQRAFNDHMLVHKREGHDVSGPLRVEEKEAEVADVTVPEDDVSIFSESGVESDAEEVGSDAEDASGLFSCPVCEKCFSCIYRYNNHWKLHCRTAQVAKAITSGTLTARPFSFKSRPRHFPCSLCKRKFLKRSSLAVHRPLCVLKMSGKVPVAESQYTKETDSAVASLSRDEIGVLKSPENDGSLTRSPRKNQAAELSRVEEDQEDMIQANPKRKTPMYVERAYMVEWDTNKSPSQKPYVCKACVSAYGDFLSLIQHVKSHIPKPITKDAQVDDTNETLDADMVQASVIQIRTSSSVAPGKFLCKICGKRFSEQVALDEHSKVHKTHKTYRCGVCRKRFWTEAALRSHRKKHNAKLGYCGICFKKFTSAMSLKKHKTMHELINSLYQCEDCSVSFFGLNSLRKHFKENHADIQMFSCRVCARIHTDVASLKEHFKQDHTGVRCSCRLCNKKFHTPMQVITHVRRVHDCPSQSAGVKKCSLCCKEFKTKAALRLHLWRHTGTANYQCRICDSPFGDMQDCVDHVIAKHKISGSAAMDEVVDSLMVYGVNDESLRTADRSFSCFVCRKKFGSKLLVRTHVWDCHRRDRKFACELCPLRFISGGQLEAHQHHRHPELMKAATPPTISLPFAPTVETPQVSVAPTAPRNRAVAGDEDWVGAKTGKVQTTPVQSEDIMMARRSGRLRKPTDRILESDESLPTLSQGMTTRKRAAEDSSTPGGKKSRIQFADVTQAKRVESVDLGEDSDEVQLIEGHT